MIWTGNGMKELYCAFHEAEVAPIGAVVSIVH